MYISRSFKIRFILTTVFILFLSTSAYAFASSNTLTVSGAGDGVAAISGYTVANIHYLLDGTDPAAINSVTFTVTPMAGAPATQVKAKLGTSSTTWFSCSPSGSTWICPVGGAVNVATADELRVVAAQ